MPNINDHANRVLAEFGGRLPAHLLQFEDARREFLEVRALQLQRLGISDTDKTVQKVELSAFGRDGTLPDDLAVGTPAFAEFYHYNNYANPDTREKIEIVPVEQIPEFEGSRVIAFYGSPLRYRAGFNFWDSGTISVWFDGVDELLNATGDMDAGFAPAFITYVVKQAAMNLVPVARLNLSMNSLPEEGERVPFIMEALNGFERNLAMQTEHWHKEFKKYVGSGLNTQSRLRRSNFEIKARGFNDLSGGRDAMDWGNY